VETVQEEGVGGWGAGGGWEIEHLGCLLSRPPTYIAT